LTRTLFLRQKKDLSKTGFFMRGDGKNEVNRLFKTTMIEVKKSPKPFPLFAKASIETARGKKPDYDLPGN
jgi:hypothetical protein